MESRPLLENAIGHNNTEYSFQAALVTVVTPPMILILLGETTEGRTNISSSIIPAAGSHVECVRLAMKQHDAWEVNIKAAVGLAPPPTEVSKNGRREVPVAAGRPGTGEPDAG